MSDIPKNQIDDWLKKLERESWQLELLVSAFTIFLLIGAKSAYDQFLQSLNFNYDMSGGALSIASVFLLIIRNSIQALTISLIIHLMLRGFWIGTIGLRSVQSSIDFERLNYTAFFTEKLKKKVISLDRMVVMLDELCSVIFAFSFLIISLLLAVGMFLAFLGVVGAIFSGILSMVDGTLSTVFLTVAVSTVVLLLIMGFIYMIDYFTLGFFKKIKWFQKIYYPFYRLYNFVTLSGLSRSIYYYLISKFSKKRIRIVYSIIAAFGIFLFVYEFDQNQFYPRVGSEYTAPSNAYDDQRMDDDFIEQVSIPSNYIDKPFFPLFIRYNVADNGMIRSHCPDFVPVQGDGLNKTLQFYTQGANFQIGGKDYSKEDFGKLLECHCAIYEVSVNDSIYTDLTYRFYTHPAKNQNGLMVVLPTDNFNIGENMLKIKKVLAGDSTGNQTVLDYAFVPFWYKPN